MQFPQIRIHSQPAQIQIEQTDAKLQIRQPNAELSIQQPPAEVSIRTTPSKLQIDQTKAWEDMNLMHIFKRNKEFAEEGKKRVLEGVARRARQGRELMEIENGGNPIVSQAKDNSQDKMKNLGITFIPSPFAVQTTYEPAKVEIEAKRNEPIIEVKTHQPVMEYSPGNVETFLKQQPELEIEFINLYV